MQFFKLGSKVKFRAHQEQSYERGTIVGHGFMHPQTDRNNPVYLIELVEGFYRPDNSVRSPVFISTLVVSYDCVEADE